MLEFATGMVVISAIILIGLYICDRFRRVANSQIKDNSTEIDCKQAILKK